VNIGVKTVKVCFGTACTLTPGLESADYEKQYQETCKPLVSALYNLPELPFTLYLSGTLIEWLEHRHPEFFMIVEEMIGRKQIDILGGGYYAPLFPLIPPVDRVAQTELLTTTLRKQFGKRPRGAWLPSSAWDPSLVSSLTTCGIEYILLDKLMLETSGFSGIDGFEPVTIEDGGKTVMAIPLDNRYRHPENYTPAAFYDELASCSVPSAERVVAVFIDARSIAPVFSDSVNGSAWFSQFLECLADPNSPIELSTTARILKNRTLFSRAYLSAGMSPFDFGESVGTNDVRILSRTSVKHLLVEDPGLLNLYAKMMYVHILVNQLRGDKSRKKNAREELLQAQNGDIFRMTEYPGLKSMLRNHAYKSLLVAEKQTRLRGLFSPSINAFDFDMDGQKEYLAQFDSLNAYVHSLGGRIFELDGMISCRNYCDTIAANSGLFIDNIVSAEEIALLASGSIPSSRPVFSETLYQEISVESGRHEIYLKANGLFGALQQPVSLRKQYSFRNEEIQVQYILKNESPLNLSGAFLIEIDLSLVSSGAKKPLMTVYAHDNRQDRIVSTDHFTDVSWIRLDESASGTHFTIDANENPSVSVFTRTQHGGGSDQKRVHYESARVFLYWKVDLSPNYETEKMVFFKINS
jgi:hypothetical protein